MVDSIRPFVALIRTLSRKKVEAPDGVAEPDIAGDTSANHAAAEANRNSELESRLRARLAAVDASNPEQARQTFVETVLLSQLGEDLARDPAFADVVARVSDQLLCDAQTRAQLANLIATLRG
jgi:hypothetical protein